MTPLPVLGSCVGKRTALRAFSVCSPEGRYLGSRSPICAFRQRSCLLASLRHNLAMIQCLLTIANNLQTVSLGCAPTPSQYFALLTSSLISFCCLSPGAAPTGVCGMGLYVPRTSRGLESRAVLWVTLDAGSFNQSRAFQIAYRACARTML